MHYHPAYGVSALEKAWVPTPSYLLRRDRIQAHFKGVAPGTVLEVGCGAGGIVLDLARMGFLCVALETSRAALELAQFVTRSEARVQVVDHPGPDWTHTFDHLLALEVLEHIEDERNALAQWREWLKPGGRLIVSVPAHPTRWNAGDVWAGHCRRYSRDSLGSVVEATGFTVTTLECYGFPLGNALESVRALYYSWSLRPGRTLQPASLRARTARSGTERSIQSRFYSLYASWAGVAAMRAAYAAQKPFLKTGLGNGLLVVAHRS